MKTEMFCVVYCADQGRNGYFKCYEEGPGFVWHGITLKAISKSQLRNEYHNNELIILIIFNRIFVNLITKLVIVAYIVLFQDIQRFMFLKLWDNSAHYYRTIFILINT